MPLHTSHFPPRRIWLQKKPNLLSREISVLFKTGILTAWALMRMIKKPTRLPRLISICSNIQKTCPRVLWMRKENWERSLYKIPVPTLDSKLRNKHNSRQRHKSSRQTSTVNKMERNYQDNTSSTILAIKFNLSLFFRKSPHTHLIWILHCWVSLALQASFGFDLRIQELLKLERNVCPFPPSNRSFSKTWPTSE